MRNNPVNSFSVWPNAYLFVCHLPMGALSTDHCALSVASFQEDPGNGYDPLHERLGQLATQASLRADPMTMDSSIPFAEALPLAVDVPAESTGKADNLIVLILGDPDNISRGNATAALAIELVSHPLYTQEPVPRGHLASSSKVLAERRLEEVKTILGWALDTRRLLYRQRSTQNDLQMITGKSSRSDKLRNTVGRLNHVGFIIPTARHFLGRIRLSVNAPIRRRKRFKPTAESA
jgi:hypothetical protein